MLVLRRISGIIWTILMLFTLSCTNVRAAEAAQSEGSGTSAAEAAQSGESGISAAEAAQSEGSAVQTAQSGTSAVQTVKEEAGSFIVEADASGNFKYEGNCLFIYGGVVRIQNRPEVETATDRIEISGNARVVLSGVNIEAVDGAAVKVIPGADAEIHLQAAGNFLTESASAERVSEESSLTESASDESESEENAAKDSDETVAESQEIIENYLSGAEGYAGIEAGTLPGSDEIPTLYSSLRISGDGSLTCIGGSGAAGIGGSRGQYGCGIISIESGQVTAVGGALADGIGCGAESLSEIAYLPQISVNVSYLCAFADGNGTALAYESAQTQYPEESDQAPILRGTFAKSADNSLTGLTGVRVKSTTGTDEITFDMPQGCRDFAVKTTETAEYMIEQGGRAFAASSDENFTGELTESGDVKILFVPSKEAAKEQVYLVPVQNTPSINIDVIGKWEDQDNKDGSRPGSVKVTLYANGNETGRTLMLNEENDWQGSFDSLALYLDSVRQSYSVVQEKVDGYMASVSGSDNEGYTITSIHDPLPEGRSSSEEIAKRPEGPVREGTIVATVVTSKVSKSMPVRTSTTIKKTRSVKTGDTSNTIHWGIMLLMAVVLLFLWMRFEQKRD